MEYGLFGKGVWQSHRDAGIQRNPTEESLYAVSGYVTNTNKVMDTLSEMAKGGKIGTPEYAN